jgi:hypothetical protein
MKAESLTCNMNSFRTTLSFPCRSPCGAAHNRFWGRGRPCLPCTNAEAFLQGKQWENDTVRAALHRPFSETPKRSIRQGASLICELVGDEQLGLVRRSVRFFGSLVVFVSHVDRAGRSGRNVAGNRSDRLGFAQRPWTRLRTGLQPTLASRPRALDIGAQFFSPRLRKPFRDPKQSFLYPQPSPLPSHSRKY